MHSTNYVITFVFIITTVVAVGLTGLREATKPLADANEAIFNKKGVLNAIKVPLGDDPMKWDGAEVESTYTSKVKPYVFSYDGTEKEGFTAIDLERDRDKINKIPLESRPLPLWVYEDNGKKYYIISVYGKGLWDKIWGTVAFESDLKTLAGTSFDHKGETPGLGAEIKDNPSFSAQYVGKKAYNDKGEYVSVIARKGGAKDKRYEVDAISGATITSNGVSKMMVEGIQNYEHIFESVKKLGL